MIPGRGNTAAAIRQPVARCCPLLPLLLPFLLLRLPLLLLRLLPLLLLPWLLLLPQRPRRRPDQTAGGAAASLRVALSRPCRLCWWMPLLVDAAAALLALSAGYS